MFPAPAGMSLTPFVGEPGAGNVPRTCGDEPANGGHAPNTLLCSPHLRG